MKHRPCTGTGCGTGNFGPWCNGRIYTTPSVTVALQAYACQMTQMWRGCQQKWRVFFQCRVNESAVEKIADTTSLKSAVTSHHNAKDPDSIDPNLPHDTLEWVVTDPTQLHTTGVLFVPWPYSHEPWHAHCQQRYVLPQYNRQVKIHFCKKTDLGEKELAAALEKVLAAESSVHKLGNTSVTKVVCASGGASPHAFVSFFNALSAAKFVELGVSRPLGEVVARKISVKFKGSIRTHHGSFLSAAKDGLVRQAASSDACEQLQAIFHPDGRASFVTTHNTFLSATDAQPLQLCQRADPGECETLEVVLVNNNKVALKTNHGSFVSALDGGGVSQMQWVCAWETFDAPWLFEACCINVRAKQVCLP